MARAEVRPVCDADLDVPRTLAWLEQQRAALAAALERRLEGAGYARHTVTGDRDMVGSLTVGGLLYLDPELTPHVGSVVWALPVGAAPVRCVDWVDADSGRGGRAAKVLCPAQPLGRSA